MTSEECRLPNNMGGYIYNNTCFAPHFFEPEMDFVLFKLGIIPLLLLTFHAIYVIISMLCNKQPNTNKMILHVRLYLIFGFILRIISSVTDPWGDRLFYPSDIIRILLFRSMQIVFLWLLCKLILEWKSFLNDFNNETSWDKVTRISIDIYSRLSNIAILVCDYFDAEVTLILILSYGIICFALGFYYCTCLLRKMNQITDEDNQRKSTTMKNIYIRITLQLKAILFGIIIGICVVIFWMNLHHRDAFNLYVSAFVVYFVEIIISLLYTFYIFPYALRYSRKNTGANKKIKIRSIIS